MTSAFVWITCQAGAEVALKREIARSHPELRMAYSRPGFVTFKSERELNSGFELRAVFARAYGLSLDTIRETDREKLLDRTHARASSIAAELGPLALHVFERDLHLPGEEPKDYVRGSMSADFEGSLRAKDPGGRIFAPPARPRTGDPVLDLIFVEPGELWLGAHEQTPDHLGFPGGIPAIQLPEQAPSRAWLKIEEALLWSGAKLQPGDVALEIGSAPGGATWNLLNRGLEVIGVDPAAMDERVLRWKGKNRFRHIRRAVQSLRESDLPHSVQWLLLDMNVSPNVSIDEIARIGGALADSLLGVFLTIKLNKWRIADEIPEMLAHLKRLGLSRVRARQLYANRQEFTVFGLTRKGALRTRA